MNQSGRVLMVASVYPRWKGDATPPFVHALARALVERDWKITVLAPHAAGAALRECCEGVEVRRFRYFRPEMSQKLCYEGGMLVNFRRRPWTKLLLPFFYLTQVKAIARLVREERPDLLHSHSLLPQGLTVAKVARRSGIPHLATSHGNDVFGLRPDGLVGRWKRRVLREADAVTVNSLATLEAVRELGEDMERVCLIPAMPSICPIEPEVAERRRAEWKTSEPVVLFVGRLIEEKGLGDLLMALAACRRAGRGFCLVICGDGADRPKFESLARDLKLEDGVIFEGWRSSDSVQAAMAAADVVAVPSRPTKTGWKEAQGLVAVEAMAQGCPVVASRFGGLAEAIDEGRNGFLFEPGDIEGLMSSIRLTLKSAEPEKLRQGAREVYTERFSKEFVVAQTSALYERILKRNGGNA